MASLNSRRSGGLLSDERILPLIDVVFLLLIFFMLAGRLSESDPFTVVPPQAETGAPASARAVTLLVGADGALALDGTRLELGALVPALATLGATSGATHGATHGATEAPLRVRLKADGRAPAARVVDVMQVLRGAGVERLELLSEAAAP